MTRLLLLLFVLVATLAAATRHPLVLNGDIERVIIPIDVAPNTYICAEYPHRMTAGQKPRACWDASRVRDKILHEAEPDQCE